MNVECTFCCALLWLDERLSNSSKINPRFGICCYQGKVKPPYHNPIPPELHWLLTHNDESGFRNHIHNYNQALAFTSVGRKVDNTLNRTGGGPYSFRLFGELIHQAGSLIPPPGKPPAWAQLYIYDSAQALNYCIGHSANSTLDRNIMQTLQDMLYRHHPSVLLYKHAFQITQGMSSEQNCLIVLCFDPHTDRCCYLPPDARAQEIAILLPGDGDQPQDCQDIILHHNAGYLECIKDTNPLYPCLRYVLLHPTGQLDWHRFIPYEEVEDQQRQNKHKYMTLAEFHRFYLLPRPPHIESNHLFLAGKLFQEYVCEIWAVAEQNRLNYHRHNQKQLHVEVYQGLQDAVAADADVDPNELGMHFILPSTFAGSTHNMQQHSQDALAINRYFGGGDLFITMTANPAWPEITSALMYDQKAPDHPDLVVRVFQAKLQSLLKDIARGVLGQVAAYLYTIEFQKRGLPHAHIIVFLKPYAKLHTPEDIDSLMSSEFPVDNDELLQLIKKFMVHTPCGNQNPSALCMVNGSCSKSFPKAFRAETTVTEDSYACTRRRDTGQVLEVQGRQVDNQWVVCHSPYLIWKYRCHINVESGRCRDEIKQYLDARYISSCEALWRLYLFGMQKQVSNVVRLQVHLYKEQGVTFREDEDGQDVIAEHADRATTLTGWFEANA